MKSRLVAVAALGLAGLALVLLILSGNAPTIAAQAPGPWQAVVGHDMKHDTSAPLSELSRLQQSSAPQSPRSLDAINRVLPNKQFDPKFLQQLKDEGIDLAQYIQSVQTPDPIIQSIVGVPYAPNTIPPTIQNFEGVNNRNGVLPPDTTGDIGYDPATSKKYYMQWVNLSYAIWDVTTSPTIVVSPTDGNLLWSGFGGVCETSNDGDVIVQYDQLAQRWLASQFALPNFPNGPYYQCIAVSTSGNPTGTWNRYQFQVSTTKMNDYPHFGVWPDGYYATVNQFNNGTTWGGAGLYVFDRARMLSGLSATFQYFDLFGVSADFGGQLPADLEGTTPPSPGAPNYVFEVDDNISTPNLGADAMRIWKVHIDWVTPANSTMGISGTPNYTVPVASFNMLPCALSGSRSCISQPGTSQKIDAIGDRLMYRVPYRNINGHETVVLNHTVDAGSGRTGIRWYEVHDIGTAPSIYQQGTYAPSDTESRWMGSVAMDHVGNVALGFSISSASVNPSIKYTGRLTADPLGVMAQGESTIISGTGSQTHTAARWGDYSTLSVDSTDDCTFYYTQEYIQTTGNAPWQTRVGSFKFPNCTLGPQGILSGTVTNASNSNPIVGAKVLASSNQTDTFATFSNGSGAYKLTLAVGTYTVTGQAYGFLPNTISGVSIVSGTTTTRNIALTPAASYVISGFVRDSVTNDPLYATVSVVGTPFNPPFASAQTNPATGFYSMTLSGGQSYTLTASALIHTSEARGVTPISNRTENFNLVATAQNGGIIGYVRNLYTNDPVVGATVAVTAPGNPQATTDATGYFQIFNLTPGFYTATASANLYSPVTISNIQVLTSNFAIRTFLLPTARLQYSPAALQRTLTFGTAITDAAGLVISNTGQGALNFELKEQGRHGPDPFGYNWVTSAEPGGPAYSWIDAAGGTALGLSDDGESNVTLPFGFTFYTATATLLRVGNNGGVLFNDPTSDVPYANLTISDTLTPNGFIAPFWDDIDSDTGDVYWTVVGSAPNRKVVIEWFNRPHYSNIGSATFEVVLFENGDILYQYQDVNFGDTNFNNGASATIGIRGPDANYSLQYSYNTPSVQDGFAICFDNPNSAGACGGSNYDALPWLTETPISSTLAQSATQNIQLGWSANNPFVPQPGTYTGTLKLDNNDPLAQNTIVPVVMNVQPAPSQGLLTGIVSTTGVCDVNPAPIGGATIMITGTGGFTSTLAANASGQYSYYLDAAHSPYTVTASAANYLATSAVDAITGGSTTTRNFTLRLLESCVSFNPNALQATVQRGSSTSRQITVTSSGVLPLNYNVSEVPDNFPAGGGPDAYGYTWITSTFSWIDATGGAALGLIDDGEANIVSPFPFPYYGQSAMALRIGNNGAVLYNATTGDVGTTNSSMASAPDNFIAPFWDDIDSGTGDVYWTVVGSAPNRRVVIEWFNRPHYSNIGSATFEVVLFENGNILYQYQDVNFGDTSFDNGAGATIGIRGVGVANRLEYSFNQPTLHDGQAICFVKPGNPPCAATDVPWLSESITGTLGLIGTPPTSQVINVTFDASQIVTPGIYTSSLLFLNNSPQPLANIPVTMTVTPGNKLYLPVIRR